jgi:hypothetical protein
MQAIKLAALLAATSVMSYQCGMQTHHSLPSSSAWGLVIIGLALLVMGMEED